MNVSASLTPFNSPTQDSLPMVLDTLPDPAIASKTCPRRTRVQIDLILLAIEALELGGSEAILTFAQELDLKGIVKDRVNLWRMRSSNPLQMEEKQIPLEQNLRLSNYLERFRAHFKSRMNARRSGVLALTSDAKLDELAINLLGQLLFCTGTTGMQRFWISLFDGEVE
jgi:hypothetical protein